MPFQVETLAVNRGWNAWATTTKLMRFFGLVLRSVSETKVKCFRNENNFF